MTILLPGVYLVSFLQRKNSENVFKILSLGLFWVGHTLNMFLVSIIGFWASEDSEKDGLVHTWKESLVIIIPMFMPFCYNFFNPVLGHFIGKEFRSNIATV